MPRTLSFWIVATWVSLAGCGRSEAEHAPVVDSVSADEATRLCVMLHEQMAACAPEYIDMSIELRTRYFPAFAEKAASPELRAAMREEGIREAVASGTGPIEAREQRCKEYVAHGRPVLRGDLAQADLCFQKVSCAEKMECVRPSEERRYQDRAKAPATSWPGGVPNMR
jgi:hypothetical protein